MLNEGAAATFNEVCRALSNKPTLEQRFSHGRGELAQTGNVLLFLFGKGNNCMGVPLNDPLLQAALKNSTTVNALIKAKSTKPAVKTKTQAARVKDMGGAEEICKVVKTIYSHFVNEKKQGRTWLWSPLELVVFNFLTVYQCNTWKYLGAEAHLMCTWFAINNETDKFGNAIIHRTYWKLCLQKSWSLSDKRNSKRGVCSGVDISEPAEVPRTRRTHLLYHLCLSTQHVGYVGQTNVCVLLWTKYACKFVHIYAWRNATNVHIYGTYICMQIVRISLKYASKSCIFMLHKYVHIWIWHKYAIYKMHICT